jgi:hypothetical protein
VQIDKTLKRRFDKPLKCRFNKTFKLAICTLANFRTGLLFVIGTDIVKATSGRQATFGWPTNRPCTTKGFYDSGFVIYLKELPLSINNVKSSFSNTMSSGWDQCSRCWDIHIMIIYIMIKKFMQSKNCFLLCPIFEMKLIF